LIYSKVQQVLSIPKAHISQMHHIPHSVTCNAVNIPAPQMHYTVETVIAYSMKMLNRLLAVDVLKQSAICHVHSFFQQQKDFFLLFIVPRISAATRAATVKSQTV